MLRDCGAGHVLIFSVACRTCRCLLFLRPLPAGEQEAGQTQDRQSGRLRDDIGEVQGGDGRSRTGIEPQGRARKGFISQDQPAEIVGRRVDPRLHIGSQAGVGPAIGAQARRDVGRGAGGRVEIAAGVRPGR